MSEKTLNIVDKDRLVEFVKSLERKDKEFKSRFHEILVNLSNSERPLKSIITDIDFERLKVAFPHFKDVITYYQIQASVAKRLKRPFQASPVLLLGSPGLGKTYFASELAKLLALPYYEISLATATANFVISGSHIQWNDSGPGFIIQSMAKSEVGNPIFLIDELDKANGSGRYDPMTPFYSLLEPHSAKKFRDEAIPLDLDVSQVIWIATANEEVRIHAPILTRFKQFVIEQPTPEEMMGVIDSVYTLLRERSDFKELISPHLSLKFKQRLSKLSPREVRIALDQAIMSAIFNDRQELITSDIPKVQKGARRVGFY